MDTGFLPLPAEEPYGIIVQNNPVNFRDPMGLFRSSDYLRYTVPGQVLYDQGMTALEEGSYGWAALNFTGMAAEQVLFALTLGQSMTARGIVTTCEVGAGGLFSKGATASFEHAIQLYRNGPLTNVGRALTKHPNIIGESGNILEKLGGSEKVNKAAAEALQNIMENGAMTRKMTKAFGEVIEYKLTNGLGARFSGTTGQFISFLGRGL